MVSCDLGFLGSSASDQLTMAYPSNTVRGLSKWNGVQTDFVCLFCFVVVFLFRAVREWNYTTDPKILC